MGTESNVKLRKLTEKDGEPVEDILQRAADQLRGLKEKATVQLRLLAVGDTNAGGRAIYSMVLTPAGAFLHSGIGRPTLVIITTSEAFYRMAEGSYSPVQAYLDGKLDLLGNVDLGKQIIVHLAGSGGNVNVCP